MIQAIKKALGAIPHYYRVATDMTPLERLEKELKEESKYLKEFLRNHDPYLTDYCTIQHERCSSCGLLAWEKDSEHRYVSANDRHLKAFYDLKAGQQDHLIGQTDAELITEWRERTGLENTFGEMCVSTDVYVAEAMRPRRFFEFGYRDGNALLLDVFKSPIIIDGKFQGTRSNALNISDRESDIYDLLQFYMSIGVAKRLDGGKHKDVAAYLIRDRQKTFDREFPV